MTTPGWDNEAWSRIEDYELFRKPFDARFHFRPGTGSQTWPAIAEPPGSVTFDLAPVFSRESGFAADEDAFNNQVLEAMTTVFAEDVAVVALDWQHPSYWFWPRPVEDGVAKQPALPGAITANRPLMVGRPEGLLRCQQMFDAAPVAEKHVAVAQRPVSDAAIRQVRAEPIAVGGLGMGRRVDVRNERTVKDTEAVPDRFRYSRAVIDLLDTVKRRREYRRSRAVTRVHDGVGADERV